MAVVTTLSGSSRNRLEDWLARHGFHNLTAWRDFQSHLQYLTVEDSAGGLWETKVAEGVAPGIPGEPGGMWRRIPNPICESCGESVRRGAAHFITDGRCEVSEKRHQKRIHDLHFARRAPGPR